METKTRNFGLSGQITAVFDYIAPYCMFSDEKLNCHFDEIRDSEIRAKNLITQIKKKIDKLEIYPLTDNNDLPVPEPINMFGSIFRDLLLSGKGPTPIKHQDIKVYKSIVSQSLAEIAKIKAITKYEELILSSLEITLESYRNSSEKWLADLSKGFGSYVLLLEGILSSLVAVSNNLWDPVLFPVELSKMQETFFSEEILTKESINPSLHKFAKINYFQVGSFVVFSLTLPTFQEGVYRV